ncbi:MAG: hypothetical protein ACUZ8O_17545 [Candidatus Anammoxibacter sp.]
METTITNKIIAKIKKSSLLIAEVTPEVIKYTNNDEEKEIINLNANVYYEAGFVHGLKIPVIYLCREDKVKYLPFDTKTINHLTWRDNNYRRRDRKVKRLD